MNLPPLLERYAGLSAESKRVVAMIALVGGMPGGKSRLVEYLRAARVKSSSGAFFSGSSILEVLSELHELAILVPIDSGESIVARAVASQAIGALVASGEWRIGQVLQSDRIH